MVTGNKIHFHFLNFTKFQLLEELFYPHNFISDSILALD